MKAVIIGAGNVATHIGRALVAKGIQVSQVWSRNAARAETLAHSIGAQVSQQIAQLDADADFCIIAVKDDAIVEILPQLSHFNGLVLHTAGAASLEIFSGLFTKYGVLYPLQTFSVEKELDFSKVPLCIEASSIKELSSLRKLAETLSESVFEINSDQRKVLHLAAVFACNFPNYLFGVAERLIADQQMDFDILRPLILETAEKVQVALPQKVQTGPAIREDEATISSHLRLLKDKPELTHIYQLLSDSIKKTKK